MGVPTPKMGGWVIIKAIEKRERKQSNVQTKKEILSRSIPEGGEKRARGSNSKDSSGPKRCSFGRKRG